MTATALIGWLAAAVFYAIFITVLCRAIGASRIDDDPEEPTQ